jgi:chromosome segregation ATPase
VDRNLQDVNEEMISKQKAIEAKESLLKENKQEVFALKANIENLEEKLKFYEIEKENSKDRFYSAEKKYKDDIINLRNKISQKDEEFQNFANDKEVLRFENDKLKQELKKLEYSKNSDDHFFNQITDIQNKYSEKEIKIIEEKENVIRGLKKEIDSLNSQHRKASSSIDKDVKIAQSENQFLKQEVAYLKEESVNNRELKDKILKLEKLLTEMQNNFAIKKVELTQTQMECDKYREDLHKLELILKTHNKEQEDKIQILEKEVVETKQKLGDVLNELSESENRNGSNKGEEKKKKFSFFGKKK